MKWIGLKSSVFTVEVLLKQLLGNEVRHVSCCLADKQEIPIPVKQEPVEFKEPVIEADKSKSRYKKFIPPVPPSPVSLKKEKEKKALDES